MKKQTKAERIRLMLKQGSSVKETAAVCGVTAQAVYNVTYQDKLRKAKSKLGAKAKIKDAVKRPRGRPRKVRVEAITPQEAEVLRESQTWTITAKYDKPRLTWKQRVKALLTGRI